MTLHHVFANRSNIGDWLSARAIQSQLPRLPLREHLCDEHFIDDTRKALAKVEPEDAIVIGGGGLIMDYFLPLWETLAGIVDRTNIFIWGIGYCDNKARASRPPIDLMRHVIGASRLCVVRDELTRNILNLPDLPPPVACPSLLLLSPPPQKKSMLLHAVHYESTGESGYEKLCDVTRVFAERSGRIYNETNNEIEHNSEKELAANVRDYSDADLVVTTRLHGCIIGLASGARVVAMSGDHKVDAFMRSVGLGDWVCDMGDYARLDDLMTRAPQQPSAEALLESARRENRQVGKQISAMLEEIHA